MSYKSYLFAVAAALILGGGGLYGGYLAGRHAQAPHPQTATTTALAAPAASPGGEPQPAYYQKPDGSRDFSLVLKKDEQGRDYIPIYAKPGTQPPGSTGQDPAAGEKKIKHYRNPMGLPDTSPVPKKDSMGMDYIPVYEEERAGAAGATDASSQATAAQGAAGTSGQKKVKFYRNPMGLPDVSPVPKKDSMGMEYIPVYEEESGPKKIKFYRNPMGLPDTSPVPKKDSMGMDYIPVYEDEAADDGSTVKVSLAKVHKLGVRTDVAVKRQFLHPVRAVGTIQLDERQESVVNVKFEGWVEKLHVNTTGADVKRGQPLFEIYSPDLVLAQQEYLIAKRAADTAGASGQEIAQAALSRLKNWDISPDQIKRLEQSGTVSRTLTIRAPADGLVMEKMAVQGMRFMPGETLYKISNLSTVWLIAQVFEKDLPLIKQGQEARIKLEALPGQNFTGKVNFIYPTVNKDTRTGQVRIEVPNRDGLLKHDMYASVELVVPVSTTEAITVPESAVLDSGVRQSVLIEKGQGVYEPRPVKVGARADGYAEILEGVAEGEKVVVSANFLIDAESNLRAALKSFTTPDATSAPTSAEGAKP